SLELVALLPLVPPAPGLVGELAEFCARRFHDIHPDIGAALDRLSDRGAKARALVAGKTGAMVRHGEAHFDLGFGVPGVETALVFGDFGMREHGGVHHRGPDIVAADLHHVVEAAYRAAFDRVPGAAARFAPRDETRRVAGAEAHHGTAFDREIGHD